MFTVLLDVEGISGGVLLVALVVLSYIELMQLKGKDGVATWVLKIGRGWHFSKRWARRFPFFLHSFLLPFELFATR